MNDDILRLISDLQRRIEALETGEVVGLDWDKTWTDAVHSHANAGEGGQLDWDVVWSDAVHDHSSNAEGGILPQDAVKVSKLVASDGAPDPALSADASGYLTAAVQPLFSAYLSASILNVTGDGTIHTCVYDTEILDRNSNYNTGTGVFTAPVTGQYHFVVNMPIDGLLSTHTQMVVKLVTTARARTLFWGNPYALSNSSFFDISLPGIADMNAGDTAYITLKISNGTKVVDWYSDATYLASFAGYLLM